MLSLSSMTLSGEESTLLQLWIAPEVKSCENINDSKLWFLLYFFIEGKNRDFVKSIWELDVIYISIKQVMYSSMPSKLDIGSLTFWTRKFILRVLMKCKGVLFIANNF